MPDQRGNDVLPSVLPSVLPKETEYWRSLSRRIRDDAEETLAGYSRQASASAPGASSRLNGSLLRSLDRAAPWLAAASVLAAAVLWSSLPPADPPAGEGLGAALLPRDATGSRLAASRPPSVESLLAAMAPEILEGVSTGTATGERERRP